MNLRNDIKNILDNNDIEDIIEPELYYYSRTYGIKNGYNIGYKKIIIRPNNNLNNSKVEFDYNDVKDKILEDYKDFEEVMKDYD